MDILIWGKEKALEKIMTGGGHKTRGYFRLY